MQQWKGFCVFWCCYPLALSNLPLITKFKTLRNARCLRKLWHGIKITQFYFVSFVECTIQTNEQTNKKQNRSLKYNIFHSIQFSLALLLNMLYKIVMQFYSTLQWWNEATKTNYPKINRKQRRWEAVKKHHFVAKVFRCKLTHTGETAIVLSVNNENNNGDN